MSAHSEKLKAYLDRNAIIPDSYIPGNFAVDHNFDVRQPGYPTFGDLRALLAERTEMIDAMRWTIRGYRAGVTPDVMADFIEEMATLAGDPDLPLPPPPEPV